MPNAGLALTLTRPDDQTDALTLMPLVPSDPIPLPHASPDTFTTVQATGAWKLSVPGAASPSLPAEAVEDLLIVLTYHATA